MLVEPLFGHAQNQPHCVAIIDERAYTYEQFGAMVAALTTLIGTQTRRPRVGLLMPTGIGFATSFYATLTAGKVAVPINFLLGDSEISHIVRDSGIDTIVTVPACASKVKDALLNVLDFSALPQPSFITSPKFPTPAPNDVAVIMYTSGTTRLPKGVKLSFENIQSCVDAAIQHARLRGTHKFLGILPLFHSTGLLATLVAPIQLGSSICYQARFSPLAAIKAIREQNISIVAAVPSMYGAILRLKDVGPADVKSLYAAISGGEPLPIQIRDGWQQKFGIPIFEGYGLTETAGPIAFNIPGHIRLGSVGALVPGASAKIVDENGNTLPPGEIGEVWLRGPMITKGYLNLPDETTEAFSADGYLKSGDMGKLDQDGYLYITGRKKELISIAGEKVSPREIEDILMDHPAVFEAVVIGKSDISRGQMVVAYVVPKEDQSPSPEELRDFCRLRGLPQWKIPREIQIVHDLPRSPGGKVLKSELIAMASSKA